MTTEVPEGNEKSGSQLRAEFEETRRALVDKYVADHPGLSHTDLNGIPVSQFAATAQEVVTTRESQRKALLAEELGVEVTELDVTLAKLKGSTPSGAPADDPAARIASLSKLGAPAARPDAKATEGLFGRARIEAAIARDNAAKS